jgi:hypothetical protein
MATTGAFWQPAQGDRAFLVYDFKISSASVLSTHQQFLVGLVQALDLSSTTPKMRVNTIYGFSDCVSDATKNVPLRLARAEAVRDGLVGAGALEANVRAAEQGGSVSPPGDDSPGFQRQLMRSARIVCEPVAVPPRPPTEDETKPRCGPDVTQAVAATLPQIRADFDALSGKRQAQACRSLLSPSCGPEAWDIVPLHKQKWLDRMGPECGTPHGDEQERCNTSVQVDKGCHYAGSVNYVMWGVLSSLCRIPPHLMVAAILAHKRESGGFAPNTQVSIAWALAGLFGWPGAKTPAGDRPDCATGCPDSMTGAFEYHWVPHHTWYTLTPKCKDTLPPEKTNQELVH